MSGDIEFCRRIGPEDLRPGIFVAVLSVVHEFYGSGAFDEPEIRPPRPVRVPCLDCADGRRCG